jgi:mannose-1-phosphate guanylyltransferase
VQSILKAFEEFLPDIHSSFSAGEKLFNTPKEGEFIEKIFSSCPNISIDYSIMEKAPNVYVQEGGFGWSDLGTWGSLHDLSPKDKDNNVILKCKALCYESSNNIITLPEGKLAVVQKLDGYIVAESDNVLMICKKEDEQEIRQYVIDAQLKFGDSFV